MKTQKVSDSDGTNMTASCDILCNFLAFTRF